MRQKNVFLLICDSLRADKFYGKQNNSITPTIDRLVKTGTYFEQAISSSDATLLSWSGLFTAKYPFRTGIRSSRFNKLNENIVTYFQIMKKSGYHFYGLLPTLSETIGLFPNFENNDYLYDLNQGLHNDVGQNIITKLESKSLSGPWFFVAHIMDLHFPLVVPAEFDDKKYGGNSYEKILSSIDTWIDKISQKIDDNTLFVITSDHGTYINSVNIDGQNIDFEENSTQFVTSYITTHIPKFLKPIKDELFFLVENNKRKKKLRILNKLHLKPHQRRALLSGRADKEHFLFDECIRIPLLFVGKGIPKGKVISQQVRSVDIMPTICEIIGIQNLPDIDGASLLKLIGGKEYEEIPAYIESTPLVLSDSDDVIGIRTSQFKYFRDKNDPRKRVHLFDLKNDPHEDVNITSDRPDVVDTLESTLQNIIKIKSIKNVVDVESDEIENELRKLGYV